MELSDGRARVRLQPVRYELPLLDDLTSAAPEWDANWLVVAGAARSDGGPSWAWEDPSLTTWEARGLLAWLRAVARGDVAPVALEDVPEPLELPEDADQPRGWIGFVEPVLGFSLAARGAGTVELRVHLQLEDGEVVLAFTLTDDRLREAADDWERELAPFPVR